MEWKVAKADISGFHFARIAAPTQIQPNKAVFVFGLLENLGFDFLGYLGIEYVYDC
jgi:hypothetical protein